MRFRVEFAFILGLYSLCCGYPSHASDVATKLITYDAGLKHEMNYEGKLGLLSINSELLRKSDSKHSTMVYLNTYGDNGLLTSRVDVNIYESQCKGTPQTFIQFLAGSDKQKSWSGLFATSLQACLEIEFYTWPNDQDEFAGPPILNGKLVERVRIQIVQKNTLKLKDAR